MKRNGIIIIVLVVLLIVLIGLGAVLDQKRQERLQTGKPLTPNIPTKEDGVLNLSGVSVYFDKSTGSITSTEVGHYLTDLITKYVPELMEEVTSEDGIHDYYEEHSAEIKEKFGAIDETEFEILYKKLSGKKIQYRQYDRLIMDSDSFIDHKDKTPKQYYSYVKCKVYYIDDSTIDFDLYVRFRERNDQPTFIVDFR